MNKKLNGGVVIYMSLIVMFIGLAILYFLNKSGTTIFQNFKTKSVRAQLINNINSKKIAKQLKKIILDTSFLKELQKKSWKNFSFDSKTISSKLDDHRKKLFLKN